MHSPELTIIPSDEIRKQLYVDKRVLRANDEDLAPLTERLAIGPLTNDLTVALCNADKINSFSPFPRPPEKPDRPRGELLHVNINELTEKDILANFAAALMRREDKQKAPQRARRAFYAAAGATVAELSAAAVAARAMGPGWVYAGLTAAALTAYGVRYYLGRPYNVPPLDLHGLQSPVRIEAFKGIYLDEKNFF